MLLANSLQNMFNEKINRLVTESGAPPSRVAGFTNECSAYLGLHTPIFESGSSGQETRLYHSTRNALIAQQAIKY